MLNIDIKDAHFEDRMHALLSLEADGFNLLSVYYGSTFQKLQLGRALAARHYIWQALEVEQMSKEMYAYFLEAYRLWKEEHEIPSQPTVSSLSR